MSGISRQAEEPRGLSGLSSACSHRCLNVLIYWQFLPGASHQGQSPSDCPAAGLSPHLQIGILKGYLETEGPGRAGEKTTTYSSPLCAVLYSRIFKQVSGLELVVPQAGRSARGPRAGPRPPMCPELHPRSSQHSGGVGGGFIALRGVGAAACGEAAL